MNIFNETVKIVWGLDSELKPTPIGVVVNGITLTMQDFGEYVDTKKKHYNLMNEIIELIERIKNKHCICT